MAALSATRESVTFADGDADQEQRPGQFPGAARLTGALAVPALWGKVKGFYATVESGSPPADVSVPAALRLLAIGYSERA